jgi:hypothetical protein
LDLFLISYVQYDECCGLINWENRFLKWQRLALCYLDEFLDCPLNFSGMGWIAVWCENHPTFSMATAKEEIFICKSSFWGDRDISKGGHLNPKLN